MFEAEYFLKSFLTQKPKAHFNHDNLTLTMHLLIKNQQAYDKFLEELETFVIGGLQDGAPDGYMEGDIDIYETPKHIYELVYEKIIVKIMKGDKVIKLIKAPKYWI